MLSKPAGQHSGQPAGQHTGLGRALSLEIVRVTERAAVAAARLRGRGAER
jgi:fructose-1,6-bisphosphatase II / sedoheptulose-1,7-bisphosphatase